VEVDVKKIKAVPQTADRTCGQKIFVKKMIERKKKEDSFLFFTLDVATLHNIFFE